MNRKTILIVFAAALAVAAAAKPQEQANQEAKPAQAAQAADAKKQPAQPAQKKETKPEMNILKDPTKLNEKAPETFKVKFNTTKGDFTLEVTRAWAPNGAHRFYNLVKNGYFTDIAFFRVISGFMMQFGIHGDPEIAAAWRNAEIKDDPVKQSNARGYITYAMRGPDTRTTQFFINFGNNAGLDGQGFSPFGKVTDGMNVVDSIYSGYGEGAPSGAGPDQRQIQMQGNAYLKKDFPRLDYIKSAQLLK